MNIVIHCGGMPFNGNTVKTESLGGSETAAYYMALELAKLGNNVTVFTNHKDEGCWDGVKYIWAGNLTEQQPWGDRFHFYAENTPHDVLIAQRMPQLFSIKWASKLNFLWLHDLALHRQAGVVQSVLWNVDSVLVVSEWHKNQVAGIYGIDKSIISVIKNGIDLSLFESDIETFVDNTGYSFIYSSRPERGLEHLVREGGIMEKIHEANINAKLYVCTYNNVAPQMRDYYEMLWNRCSELPNVELLGNLNKKQLADLMRQCYAMVYPTEFEEVSCITAMETMAANLPLITSSVGALPETTDDSGTILIPLKDGVADEHEMFRAMRHVIESPERHFEMRGAQARAKHKYEWKNSAASVVALIEDCFATRTSNEHALAKHFIHNSDYYAAKSVGCDTQDVLDEFECYHFAEEHTFQQHYESYYEYEKERGVDYGPESLDGNTRFETVSSMLSTLEGDSVVLDYGCAHGHYTINLAKRYPNLFFIGVDLAESNIIKAKKWAADDSVGNVQFYNADGFVESYMGFVDTIIAAEVLEHVAAPWELVDNLSSILGNGGKFIITVPYGPWEAQGYAEHHPWRAHIHHFERDDLKEVFGHHPNYKVNVAPSGRDKFGDVLGSYIVSFDKPTSGSGRINYSRKLQHQNPRQTLSVCMIAKNAESTLRNCLESVKDIADEIIIGIDETSSNETINIAFDYAHSLDGKPTFSIKSPLEIGFDEARNQVIKKASCDWILWVDADEVIHNPNAIIKYLRQNQFNGYAIKQHHFSIEPAGILKTDLPCKLFRNHKGIKFFGVVHEHPEIKLNEGLGHATLIPDVVIAHNGYTDEQTRRNRFQRNISLLVRDREKNPDRHLGKFLWIRDLAQMCNYEMEANGGNVTHAMQERAKIGIALWQELLNAGQTRMLIDGLDFYSTLNKVAGDGIDFAFKIDASKFNGGTHLERVPEVKGHFASIDHARQLMNALLTDRTAIYESKYF